MADEVNAVQPVISSPPIPTTINACDVTSLQTLSRDKLPSGWSSACVYSHTDEDSLAFYKLQLQQKLASVNVAYMVTVSPDCSWTLCIGNKIINTTQCSRLNSLPEIINSVNELIQLFLVIDGSINTAMETQMTSLVSHKGIFKNQQGFNI